MKKKEFMSFLKKELIEEKQEIDDIDYNIGLLKERLLEKKPTKFGIENIVSSFLGAILIGMTFALKGGILRTAKVLDLPHVVGIILFTNFIIFSEIYFISFNRIKKQLNEKTIIFFLKRYFSIGIVSLFVSLSLTFLLGLNIQTESTLEVFKVIIILWMASSIGSGIPGLIEKY